MKDFSKYASDRERQAKDERKGSDGGNGNGGSGMNPNDLLKMLAGQYEGKSEDELLAAILSEAQKARKNGNLSDGDIDNFVNSVMPMLSASQQKKLMKIVKYLKSGKATR